MNIYFYYVEIINKYITFYVFEYIKLYIILSCVLEEILKGLPWVSY